jgi:hypothetical protein
MKQARQVEDYHVLMDVERQNSQSFVLSIDTIIFFVDIKLQK